MNSNLVFGFLFIRFCIIYYIISDSFHLIRLRKLYKKYRDKRLHPRKYSLVPLILFLQVIKDVIFICYNEIIYVMLSPLSCYISMIVLLLDLRPHFDILYVLYPTSFSIDYEPVNVYYDDHIHRHTASVLFVYFILFLLGMLAVIVNPSDYIYERIFITTIAVILCLVFGIKSLQTSHKDKKELTLDILLLLCPLLLFFSRDFCILCLLLSGLQIYRMAMREKRRGAPLLKTHWERLVIWKFMAGVFFILWGCVETAIWIIRCL